KQKLGGISKQGDRYLRRLLIVGATAVIRHARAHPEKHPWIMKLLAKAPAKKVAVALANKMARIAWAILGATSGTARRTGWRRAELIERRRRQPPGKALQRQREATSRPDNRMARVMMA